MVAHSYDLIDGDESTLLLKRKRLSRTLCSSFGGGSSDVLMRAYSHMIVDMFLSQVTHKGESITEGAKTILYLATLDMILISDHCLPAQFVPIFSQTRHSLHTFIIT